MKTRVKEGGHNIPENVIKTRYTKGINNLFNIYLPIVDNVMLFDNSYGKHELIAYKINEKLGQHTCDGYGQKEMSIRLKHVRSYYCITTGLWEPQCALPASDELQKGRCTR